jgi:hypothetical protein
MNEQSPDQVGEWSVGLNQTGLVTLTFVHSSSMKAYLSGKGQKTHLTLTAWQAKSLGAHLVDASSG